MKKYDFIFGLGRACACSQSLRLAGLQLLSLPWDWISITLNPDGPDLNFRVDIMESGFADWLREEDLVFATHIAATGKDQYINRRNNIIYPHDFLQGISLHESYPKVKAKYDRRVERFKRLMIEAKKDVLAVYMDSPVAANADVETCKNAQRRLQALYPHVKVDFLMISLEYGRSYENRTVENLGDGFTHVAFDFKDYRPGKFDYSVDLGKCAAVMKAIASVRDYRTRAEIKAMNERTRRQKMLDVGANNKWEYFWFRRRRELARLAEPLSPRVILAHLRRKKFDHVLSLGMNCEPAFRFSLLWGFVDSTPFSWAACSDLAIFAQALYNPKLIGSEGFSWNERYLMWRCGKTGLHFHGKLAADFQNPIPPSDALEADKTDLVQRLAYLNDKFTRILSDNSRKALILRVHTKTVMSNDVNEQIDAVQRALEMRGAKNYTLVVVTERAVRGRIAPAPNRVIRSVKAFNPGNSVVKPKLGDPIGWQALFTEFSPAKILPKKHSFKFEKGDHGNS